ncbi:hypothetical protein [Archangium lansingense]|uniref:Lipoprotein n=1 Tax=Archangium lansingense TaxID=2995310 RepID=A0ABT3ZW30_9BACT|nr:hypothetical protein [Archangium lansinium]MCY1073602.1 hypothetical protein [Archangium lansinium]
MAGKMKTGLPLVGLLAGSLVLGTGCKRAEAEARPQDLLQQQQEQDGARPNTKDDLQGEEALPPEQDTLDRSGTGGAGDTRTQSQDEDTLERSGTGGALDQGTTQEPNTLDEPGTGGSIDPSAPDEDIMDEPGTGGAGSTGQDTVRDEDEGVLQPGKNDEGLDHNEGQVDEDTVSPPGARPQPEQQR